MLHKDVRYEKRVLPNGVPVYFALSPHATNLNVRAILSVGQMAERPDQFGVAHALEHIVLTGTETRNAESIARVNEEWGGYKSAATGNFNISFDCSNDEGTYAKPTAAFDSAASGTLLAQKHALKMIDHISDVILRPTFPAEAVRRELHSIRNEIGFRHDSDRYYYDHIIPKFLAAPYNRNVVGSKDEVSRLSRDTLTGFYDEHFVAENVALYIAGPDMDIDALLEHAARSFKDLCSGPAHVKPDVALETNVMYAHNAFMMQNEAYVLFAPPPFRTPRDISLHFFALGLSADKVQGQMRTKRGSSYNYHIDTLGIGNRSIFNLNARPDPSETAATMTEFIRTFLDCAPDIEPSLYEANQKSRVFCEEQRVPADAVSLMNAITLAQNMFGDFRLLYDQSEVYQSLSREDASEYMRGILQNPLGTACLGPQPQNMPALDDIRAMVTAAGQAFGPKPAI